MELNVKSVLLTFLVVIFCIITGMLFAATKITTGMFLTINFIPLMQSIISLKFVYFAISATITVALILFLGNRLDKPLNFLVPGAAYLVGAIISLVLFNLTEYFLVIVISIAGIPLAVSYLAKKEEEVKYLKKLRAGISGAGRFMLIFSLAILIYISIVGFYTRDSLENNVTGDILAISLGNQETLAQKVQGQFIDMLVSGQQATVQGIKSTPGYVALEKKTDVEALTFVATMEAIETHFKSEAYKKELNDQIALNPQKNIGETIITQIPLIGFIKKYAWIMYIVTTFFLVTMISEIFMKNIAGIFYFILSGIDSVFSRKQNTEQNPKN